MSVGAAIWRQIASRGETVSQRDVSSPVAANTSHPSCNAVSSLVHQLFYPAAGIKRSSILFAAADAHSKNSGLCEQVAVALSNSSGGIVGIVESDTNGEFLPLKKKPANVSRSVWQAYTTPVAERVRRIPSALVCDTPYGSDSPNRDGLEDLRSAFSYFLLSAAAPDREIPALCKMCDAAVLVVTANITRKQTALRAKEMLLRQGVTLLGTVLDQRTLPIPESIYRLL
jgi:hypothetical protein